ncbi:uncharacterized protein LOC113518200 [Galleria mellonella]|uniref:Uncharacterized protein LOC113518200 n=1 Tax=Galleria mellonella TaxID=7137 RepID=A0A6J1WSR5_GALME|nr:uncharacterized protein LOC113518200 [Galleria mellonella]
MKSISALVILSAVMWQTQAFPGYPYFGSDVDSLSFGSVDNTRGGVALSRYYNPYYNNPRSAVGGGMAAFMFRPPEGKAQTSSQYYYPDRRRQTQPELLLSNPPPQQNEVYFPQPEKPGATEATEIADPTERSDILPTTARATAAPEFTEPEIEEVEEPVQKPKKRVSKRKQVKKPSDDDDDEDDYAPRLPSSALFPMFFGWGGKSGGGAPGATAIANAYSTGRGGVATSHATAYGIPTRPEQKLQP